VPIEVQPVFSKYRSSYSASFYTKLVAQLVRDEERNQLVADVTARQVRKGNSVLVLSRQIKHLELIAERLPEELEGHYAIVTGRLHPREREEMIEALRDGSLRCVLGTQIFEEGVDVPRLNRVVLAFPGTDVTTLQKVGRATRSFEGKTMSLVIDVVDPDVPVLKRQWGERKHWYEKTAKIRVRRPIDTRRQRDGKEEVDWTDPEARRRVLDRFRRRGR
jgi:superfamily II DNA or RNA helicase